MKKKIKAFMEKPMTWGGYTKMCVISTIIGIVIGGIEWLILCAPTLKKKEEPEVDCLRENVK